MDVLNTLFWAPTALMFGTCMGVGLLLLALLCATGFAFLVTWPVRVYNRRKARRARQ